MNDEFNSIKSENEKDSSAETRRPIRRARRTIVPFSELGKSAAETKHEEIAEAPAETPVEEAVEAPAEVVAEEAVEAPAEIIPEEVVEAPAEVAAEEAVEAPVEIPAEEEAEAPVETTAEEVTEAPEETPAEEAVEAAEEEKKEELSPAASTFDWVKSFLFSLTAVIFVFTLLFRGVTVNGGSMLPTLNDGEYLIISDLNYTPKTGDIVVVQSPHYKEGKEPLIKRIIAVGGQKVKINFQTWEVWVDGKRLHEDYILRDSNSWMEHEDMTYDKNGVHEFTVEENCVFVMGDHRNDSLDSRSNSVGEIDERYIMGRVLLRITPFEKFGKVE